MSYANSTPLRIGATGTLNGWRVRVAGRVVLGVSEGGETYYWNEFNLVDDSGNSATLVLEETEQGPEWKLFRAIEPLHPLDARAAAEKHVGDQVNLDGRPVAVTLTGASRVYHIEGEAPEGVEVGDVANYFNADTGDRMLVASWTGHEIEFYEGLDVPPETLATAFGLPRHTFSAAGFSGGKAGTAATTSRGFLRVVVIVLGLFSFFGFRSCFSGSAARERRHRWPRRARRRRRPRPGSPTAPPAGWATSGS